MKQMFLFNEIERFDGNVQVHVQTSQNARYAIKIKCSRQASAAATANILL